MRVLKTAVQNFFRNFGLSSTVVIILILMFISISLLLSLNILVRQTIQSVQEKVDLSIYLKPGANQNLVNALRTDLENLNEVLELKMITPEEALNHFREVHKNEPTILQALEEVEGNPFGFTLLVKTKMSADQDAVLSIVNSARYQDIIWDKDVVDYQQMINLVDSFGRRVTFIGIILSAIFILVAALIIFNALHLSIYTRLEEIKIMRLVGATAWSIRAPFLLEIFLAVISAWGVSIGLFMFLLHTLEPFLINFLNLKFGLMGYILDNFAIFFGSQLIFALIWCSLSSAISMKKYLKI